MMAVRIAALAVSTLLVLGTFGWYQSAAHAPETSKFLVHPPMDFRGVKAGFKPEQMVWVKPLIRMMACVFAENAVRQHLEPAPVGFPSCGGEKIKTTLGDNLIDMAVSGMATVGDIEHPFTVILQHYPPSTDEDGFNVTAISVK